MDVQLPRHIAIIPDGNRRWAKNRHLPAFMGHRAGAKITESIFRQAFKLGIPYITFWGASMNNVTKRDAKEVGFLFDLFTKYFEKLSADKTIHKNQVRVRVLGRWADYFPDEAQKAIRKAVDATKNYSKFGLTLLLAYNGTEEMVSAVKSIENPGQITEEAIKKHLYTHDLPPVDLVIRTGGDPHLSTGFMMWDTADAQLYFSPKMWPDFGLPELEKALKRYSETERRGGA